MKKQLTKKLFAFIVTFTILFALPEIVNAQRHCKPGYFLVCDQNGKHCECLPFYSCPRPPCVSFLGKIISSYETSLKSIDPNLAPKSVGNSFFSEEVNKISAYAFDRPKTLMKIPAESISKKRELELLEIRLE